MRRRRGSERAPTFAARVVLGCCRRIAPLLRPLGVQPGPFVALIALRLLLDARPRRSLSGSGGTGFTFDIGAHFLVNALISLCVAIVILAVRDVVVGTDVLATVLLFWIPLLALGPWIDLVLDRASGPFLGPLPVDGRTVLASRLVFLGVVASGSVVTVTLIPIVVGTLCYGPYPWLPAVLATVPLAAGLGLLGILVLALGLTHLVRPERYRRAVLRLQFALAVFFPIATQILPRMLGKSLVNLPTWTRLAYPPAWFGALPAALAGRDVAYLAPRVALSLGIPCLALLAAFLLARGRFAVATTAPEDEDADAIATRPSRLAGRIRDAITAPGGERAAYEVTRILSRRERSYVTRTIPNAIALVAITGFAMYSIISIDGVQKGLDRVVLFAPLFPLLFAVQLQQLLVFARYSESADAGWIWWEAPEDDSAAWRSGLEKMLLVRWVVLPSLAGMAVALALGGPQRLLFGAVAGLAALHLGILVLAQSEFALPFFEEFSQTRFKDAMNPMRAVLHMFGAFAFGAGLYALRDQTLVLAGLLAIGWIIPRRRFRPARNAGSPGPARAR